MEWDYESETLREKRREMWRERKKGERETYESVQERRVPEWNESERLGEKKKKEKRERKKTEIKRE